MLSSSCEQQDQVSRRSARSTTTGQWLGRSSVRRIGWVTNERQLDGMINLRRAEAAITIEQQAGPPPSPQHDGSLQACLLIAAYLHRQPASQPARYNDVIYDCLAPPPSAVLLFSLEELWREQLLLIEVVRASNCCSSASSSATVRLHTEVGGGGKESAGQSGRKRVY